jgi:hypothetical protein
MPVKSRVVRRFIALVVVTAAALVVIFGVILEPRWPQWTWADNFTLVLLSLCIAAAIGLSRTVLPQIREDDDSRIDERRFHGR